MKKLLQILILFVLINASTVIISEKATAQTVSFQVFYDDLSPYGSWYENPDYGYVWRPSMSGFTPYSTGGYWVLTDYGWTWVSDYSWGWAPFHYGRWYYDDSYGYVWVPGYEWGPGWVTWRRSDDYYGWAPIGPGVSISIAYSSGYNIPYNHWNFVRCNEFGRRDIHNYYIDRSKNVTIINNTTVINTTKVDNTRRTTFTPGPDRAEVQRKVGRSINPVAVVDENKPAQRVTKNNIQLYRPVVENKEVAERKPAPKKVMPMRESKEQAANQRKERENQFVNERTEKKAPAQPGKSQPDEQRTKQNNQRNEREPAQRPERKPVRDEQPTPVKRPPVTQGDNGNAQPEKQQPVRRQRDDQSQQPDRPQRKEMPQQQPEQRQRPQRVEPNNQQQQQPPQRVERSEPRPQPQRQEPQRQQRVTPRQNMDHPQPRQHEQQPPRQAPVERPTPPQRERKG